MSPSTETPPWSLSITLETFGTDHKKSIVKALNAGGYRPKLVKSKGVYSD